MFKWGFILLGLFFLWGGIDNHLNYSDPVSEDAKIVDYDGLLQLIRDGESQYISFDGKLDQTGRIYTTYHDYPPYTQFAPWDIQKLDPLSRDLDEYLGAVVEMSLGIDRTVIEMESALINEDNQKTSSSIKLAAPLMGTQAAVWVMSPPFRQSEEDKKNEWLAQRSFTGRMTRLNDLNRNNPKLQHKVSELKSTFSQTGGGFIPSAAVILDTYIFPVSDKRRAKFKYYALIEDTELALYVDIIEKDEADIANSGKISGVLKSYESKSYAGFAKVLGDSLPKRIGIVSMGSGKDFNEDNFFYTKVGVIGGLIFLGIGLLIGKLSKKR